MLLCPYKDIIVCHELDTLMPSIDLLDKFIIDRRRGAPLHEQILRALRKMIEAHFQDGDAFFTEMEIVERLGVSRATVRQALGELSRDGTLLRRPSIGTVVSKKVVTTGHSGMPFVGEQTGLSYVGVVIPEYDSEMTAMLLQKIVEESRFRGYTVQAYYTHRGEDLQRAYRQIRRSPAEERFILYLTPEATVELSEALWDSGYRTVSIEAPSRTYSGTVVETDARMAVQMGIDYLRSLGHERITLLVNEPAVNPERDILPVARDRLAERFGITHITIQFELRPCAQADAVTHFRPSEPIAAATSGQPDERHGHQGHSH